jgi:hypothetical protein
MENACTAAVLSSANPADLVPVTIEAQITFPGMSADAINSDPNTLVAIKLALKNTVPGVTDVQITVTAARRNLETNHQARRLSTGALITATLASNTLLLGYSGSQSGAAASASSGVLTSSVSTGLFASNLVAAATSSGSSLTSQLSASSKGITVTTSILTTNSPSQSPTILPGISSVLSSGNLAAIVIMSFVGAVCCLGFFCFMLSHHRDRKYKMQLEQATMNAVHYEKQTQQDSYHSLLGGIQLHEVYANNDTSRSGISVNESGNFWEEEQKDDKMVYVTKDPWKSTW